MYYEIVSPRNVRCYMPIKSYQHACLNMNGTRMKSIEKLKCMGENSGDLNPR